MDTGTVGLNADRWWHLKRIDTPDGRSWEADVAPPTVPQERAIVYDGALLGAMVKAATFEAACARAEELFLQLIRDT